MFSHTLNIDMLYLLLLCESGYWSVVHSEPPAGLGREDGTRPLLLYHVCTQAQGPDNCVSFPSNKKVIWEEMVCPFFVCHSSAWRSVSFIIFFFALSSRPPLWTYFSAKLIPRQWKHCLGISRCLISSQVEKKKPVHRPWGRKRTHRVEYSDGNSGAPLSEPSCLAQLSIRTCK